MFAYTGMEKLPPESSPDFQDTTTFTQAISPVQCYLIFFLILRLCCVH